MNILFCNSVKEGVLGGGEKWMLRAARGLTEAGHRTYIGTSSETSQLFKAANKEKIPAASFGIRGDFSPAATFRIYRFLRKNQIDILVCGFNKDLRTAAPAARIYGKTKVIARHGVLLCPEKPRYRITLKLLADSILTNTNSIKKAYLDYGWFNDDFIKVIYNPLPEIPEVQAFDFRSIFGERPVIFSAGRLTGQKGYIYLIKAAVILRKKFGIDAAFAVAGRGNQEDFLKQKIRESELEKDFLLLGHREDIYSLMKGCYAFVLPSRHEGMPNALMEAMATGKPCAASNVNGVPELIKDGETGIIFEPGSAGQAAAAIKELISNPDRSAAIGKAAAADVKTRFAFSKKIKELENFFTEVLNL
ncbi:MAG: glycosyltransferase [Fibrobacterota bacterium]